MDGTRLQRSYYAFQLNHCAFFAKTSALMDLCTATDEWTNGEPRKSGKTDVTTNLDWIKRTRKRKTKEAEVPYSRVFESMISVTGPSLTKATCIMAAN